MKPIRPAIAVFALSFSSLSCVAPPDANSSWELTVTSGSVAAVAPSGGQWDTFGGAPDPVVCLTINGTRVCTPESRDRYSPVWNYTFPVATAGALQAGITVEFYDNDTVGSEAICATTRLAPSNGDFASGGGSISCGGSSFNYDLAPR